MNKRSLPADALPPVAAVLAAVLAAVVAAIVGCQQHPAPAPQAAAKVVQPKLLDVKLDKALANQESLVARAAKIKLDSRLPAAAAHSAGGQAEAQLARQEAAPAQPSAADDKRSLAVWFSGNEIGETDPCG